MSDNITKLTPSGLAALLCARICHDMISPVGALGTALEILDDESNIEMHEDALDLVRNASRQATAKLKFLRLAFGAAGSAPGIVATQELQSLTTDMFGGGKADIVWQLADDGVEKNRARLLLNLIMLGVQAIPRGGELLITQSGADLNVAAKGEKSRLDPAIAAALTGKAPDGGFDGRSIQPFYARMMANELGGSISAGVNDDTVTFTASIPPV